LQGSCVKNTVSNGKNIHRKGKFKIAKVDNIKGEKFGAMGKNWKRDGNSPGREGTEIGTEKEYKKPNSRKGTAGGLEQHLSAKKDWGTIFGGKRGG